MPSYEKNKKSGLWSVRFREASPENGTTVNKRLSGFKTKKEAQYGYEDYVAEQKRSASAVPNGTYRTKTKNRPLGQVGNISTMFELVIFSKNNIFCYILLITFHIFVQFAYLL